MPDATAVPFALVVPPVWVAGIERILVIAYLLLSEYTSRFCWGKNQRGFPRRRFSEPPQTVSMGKAGFPSRNVGYFSAHHALR